MPHWLIKSATQRAISLLPGSRFWNEMFQKHVTRSLTLSADQFELRLEGCRKHLDHLRAHEPGLVDGFRVFELGTGWYPIIPVGLHLCGAAAIWTADIQPLLRPARIRETLACFRDYAQSGRLRRWLPDARPERLAKLDEALEMRGERAPGEALERMGIHYMVRDARDTQLEAGSIDFIFSNSVLEYIPAAVLGGLLAEFRRIASPEAIMSHRIVMMDQFAHFDHGITEFNFLRFTGRQWRWFESPLTRHTRLRLSDYRRLFQEAGFEIVSEENMMGQAERLARVPLAPEFRHYAQEDLLVLESWLAARAALQSPHVHTTKS